jgi:hypothetical protein
MKGEVLETGHKQGKVLEMEHNRLKCALNEA